MASEILGKVKTGIPCKKGECSGRYDEVTERWPYAFDGEGSSPTTHDFRV